MRYPRARKAEQVRRRAFPVCGRGLFLYGCGSRCRFGRRVLFHRWLSIWTLCNQLLECLFRNHRDVQLARLLCLAAGRVRIGQHQVVEPLAHLIDEFIANGSQGIGVVGLLFAAGQLAADADGFHWDLLGGWDVVFRWQDGDPGRQQLVDDWRHGIDAVLDLPADIGYTRGFGDGRVAQLAAAPVFQGIQLPAGGLHHQMHAPLAEVIETERAEELAQGEVAGRVNAVEDAGGTLLTQADTFLGVDDQVGQFGLPLAQGIEVGGIFQFEGIEHGFEDRVADAENVQAGDPALDLAGGLLRAFGIAAFDDDAG